MTTVIVPETDATAPAVSVIVPCLNSARTIARCMRALGAQRSTQRCEVIVVHSGEDDTLAVAQAALSGVRVRQLPTRALAATARNAGVEIARGAVLAFVDSDVYVDEAWLDAVVAAAATGSDLICGAISNANPENAVSRAEQIVMFSEFFPETPERQMWFALAGNTVMRRAVYDRCGPFVEIRAAEDLIFSRRLRMAGARILFYPRMRVFHDNRKTVRPYLRNQMVLGKYTAMARRIVPFEDTSSYWLFVLAVPISPLAKLAKIGWRLYRWMPRQLLALVRELPLVLLGVLAYGAGQAIGTVEALRGRTNPFEPVAPHRLPGGGMSTRRGRDPQPATRA